MAENQEKPNDIAYNNGSLTDPRDVAIHLNEMILNHPIYKNYVEAKSVISRHPQYKEKVDHFRKKQITLETKKINNIYVDSQEEIELANEYSDVCLISVCNDFFQAEMELLEMLKSIYAHLCDNIELDMNFLK